MKYITSTEISSKLKAFDKLRQQTSDLAESLLTDLKGYFAPLILPKVRAVKVKPGPGEEKIVPIDTQRKKRVRITPEIRQTVLRMEREGKTIKETMAVTGISDTSVSMVRATAKKQPGGKLAGAAR